MERKRGKGERGDGKGIPPKMSRINTVYRTFLNQLMSVGKSNALSDNLTFKLQAQCHLQARRQEMKWEVFFVKKWKMGGVFCKVDLSSTQVALCTVSVFFILHFNYLGVRTHPPCLRAWN